MAYYNRGFQTPLQKQIGGIAFILLGIFMLVMAISAKVTFSKLEKRCTAQEIGLVADVDYRSVRGTSGGHAEYQARLSFPEDSVFGDTGLTTEWTKKRYVESNPVKVFYDPNDPSVFYIEGDGTENSGIYMLLALLFLAVGLYTFKTAFN